MINLFWHRRDLRVRDNAGLWKALKDGLKVQPIFIFDTKILSKLPTDDQRVLFIYREIERLKTEYQNLGSDLLVRYGDPTQIIPGLVEEFQVKTIFTNRDYEPYALERDKYLYE